MKAGALLALYERVADAPDAIARLRRFVLDLAVRGKLVEQEAADEPASELLVSLIAETQRNAAGARGVRRSSSARQFQSSEDFLLPSSWVLTDLGTIATKITDGAHKTPTYVASGTPFVSVKDFSAGHLDLRNTRRITEAEHHSLFRRCDPRRGDILLGRIGTLGKAVIVQTDEEFSLFVSVALIRFDHRFVLPEWLRLLLNSPLAEAEFNRVKVGGATHTNKLNLGDLHTIRLPLAPLAEQHRIVAKVDELMALLDRLEAARSAREATRDRLTTASLTRLTAADTDPESLRTHVRFTLDALPALTTRADQIKQLRQSILNLAVRGKLVEQRADDEPASALVERIACSTATKRNASDSRSQQSKPPSALSNPPFDLPPGWTWAHFPDLGRFGRGKSRHRPRNDPSLYVDGVHLMIQTGDVARSGGDISTFSAKYNDVGLAQSLLWPAGALCITIAANIADSGILGFDACFPDSVVGFVPSSHIGSARYFEYFMRTAKANLLEFAPSTAQKNINLEILSAVLIPLPPQAEQRRIVAKVDELMALCDRLEAALQSADSTRARLLDALLHEALAGERAQAA
jgi:type I restriction enzyme S subunit